MGPKEPEKETDATATAEPKPKAEPKVSTSLEKTKFKAGYASVSMPARTGVLLENVYVFFQAECHNNNFRTYRGGGLPDVHRGFFTKNKKYRCPYYFASTTEMEETVQISSFG